MSDKTRSHLVNNEYFIIDTRTLSNRFKGVQMEYKDLEKNKEYAELVKMQNEGTLADKYPRLDIRGINRSASNFHEKRMLEDPATNLADCDEDGLIYIHKSHGKEAARKLLRAMQETDRDIKASKYGIPFIEEQSNTKHKK